MDNQKLSPQEYQELLSVVDRQLRLEKEMQEFKEQIEREIQKIKLNIMESHKITYSKVEEVAKRMDGYEKEIIQVREEIGKMSQNVENKMETIDITLSSINGLMSSMTNSQAELIKVQNNTIRSLWKAFFAVLGIITTCGGLLAAYLGG